MLLSMDHPCKHSPTTASAPTNTHLPLSKPEPPVLTRIINQNINLPQRLRHPRKQSLERPFLHVQHERRDLSTLARPALLVRGFRERGDFVQLGLAARGEDQVRARAGEEDRLGRR